MIDGKSNTASRDAFIREKYTLVRMQADDIVPVWETLVMHVKNASDSSYFLHQDLFFPVAGILNRYGIHPAGCKLRFCSKSSTAHIIGVHVGFKNEKKNIKFKLLDERAQLVVKVSRASTGFGVHEIKVLQHLHRSLLSERGTRLDPTAYVVATYVPPPPPTPSSETAAAAGCTGIDYGYCLFRSKDAVMSSCLPAETELHHDPQILVEKIKDANNQITQRQYRVEWYKPNVPENWRDDFCAILMFFGDHPFKPELNFPGQIFNKPLKDLLGKIHQANVLHTDLRPSNWRLFSNLPGLGDSSVPLVIDFDHAVFLHPSEDDCSQRNDAGGFGRSKRRRNSRNNITMV